jgi:hypothetical protein
MDFVAFLVFASVPVAIGLWLAPRFARRLGIPTDRPRTERVRIYAVLGVVLALGLLAVWAIVKGHAALGIAILVAVYVLPNLVTIPIRIRQSNRRAREARSRREGSD